MGRIDCEVPAERNRGRGEDCEREGKQRARERRREAGRNLVGVLTARNMSVVVGGKSKTLSQFTERMRECDRRRRERRWKRRGLVEKGMEGEERESEDKAGEVEVT